MLEYAKKVFQQVKNVRTISITEMLLLGILAVLLAGYEKNGNNYGNGMDYFGPYGSGGTDDR